MNRVITRLSLAAALVASLAACQEARPERTYVQTNVVRKDVFEGEWYFARTVVDHNYESAYFTFKGDMTFSYELGTMERVRWIIDEDHLYAVRTYELIDGGNNGGRNPDFLGEPVAAFPIDKHFDIAWDYNATTGERTPVEVENDYDRFWWERDYMRVDWSQNHVLGYYWNSLDAYETFGYVQREPTPFFCDVEVERDADGNLIPGGSECPASWRPTVNLAGSCPKDGPADCPDACPDVCRQVMRVPAGQETFFESAVRGCAAALHVTDSDITQITGRSGRPLIYADLAPWETRGCHYIDELVDDPAGGEEPPYYLSFVTQEVWSPSIGQAGMYCDVTAGIPCNSFIVSVRSSFLRNTPNPDFEPINVKNSMWDRFGVIRMSQKTYARGSLPDDEEGMTRDYGETDALNYWGAVHDIWADDLSVDDTGNRVPRTSPNPYRPAAERAVRPIVYTLTKDFPPYLVEPSMQAAWEWNVTFMNAVRSVRGIPLPGEDGPDYDCRLYPHTSSGYDPADPPDITGFPSGAMLDLFTPAVAYSHRFEGTECVLKLQPNPCNVDPDDPADPNDSYRECAELGDIRYNFWAWIDLPGAPFSGVSLPLQDPRNGRLVAANVNVTQESVERNSTSALIELGLAAPDVVGWDPDTLAGIMSGEDKREYYENLGKVEFPALLAPIGHVSTEGAAAGFDPRITMNDSMRDDASARLREFKDRFAADEAVERRAMLHSDRVYTLAGTQLERQMLDFPDLLNLYTQDRIGGISSLPLGTRPTDEPVLAEVSPFRVGFAQQMKSHRDKWMKQFDSRHCFFPGGPGDAYVDNSLVNVARELRDYDANQIAIELRRRMTKWVYLHEMGHSLGMEHNFGGSADVANYHDQYYEIARAPGNEWPVWECPEPNSGPCTYDGSDDVQRYYDAVRDTQYARELAGIDRYHFASVMDYPPEMYNQFHSLGRYDKGYALFAYARQVEAYENDPRTTPWDDSTADPTRCYTAYNNRADPGDDVFGECNRLRFTFYLGGESCETDDDCPFSAGKPTLTPGQPAFITQKCAENYRQTGLPADAPPLPRQCSNFDTDFANYVSDERRTIGTGTSPQPIPFFPIKYKNCGNSRVGDISWCNMFDEGASFREVVMNLREFYHRVYPFGNFRRYRAGWQGGVYWFIMDTIGKIYQHMLYRLSYERGFEDLRGGYGWEDQYLAAADGMHFLAEIVGTPDIGSYKYDPFTNSYDEIRTEEFGAGDLDVRLGLGKYMWSAYETGLYGFYRQARQGLVLDKMYAMMALVLRDWGVTWGIDERYYINFYDFFSSEMTQLFGGLMLDNPYWYGPRMTGTASDPRLTYMPLWRGWCGLYSPQPGVTCIADSRDAWGPEVAAVGGNSNVILRNFALAFALAEFPVFYNTTFEQQLYVALAGGADYFEVPGCDIDSLVSAGETESDSCVVYTSPTYHKTYVAAKLQGRYSWEDELPLLNASLSADLLRDMNGLVGMLDLLRDPATPDTALPESCRGAGKAWCTSSAQERLDGHEGFLLMLIEMMHRYGISSWF